MKGFRGIARFLGRRPQREESRPNNNKMGDAMDDTAIDSYLAESAAQNHTPAEARYQEVMQILIHPHASYEKADVVTKTDLEGIRELIPAIDSREPSETDIGSRWTRDIIRTYLEAHNFKSHQNDFKPSLSKEIFLQFLASQSGLSGYNVIFWLHLVKDLYKLTDHAIIKQKLTAQEAKDIVNQVGLTDIAMIYQTLFDRHGIGVKRDWLGEIESVYGL